MAETAEAEINRTWRLAAEAFPAAELEARERELAFLGGLAIRGTTGAEPSPEKPNTSTLLHALQEAAMGDEPSRRVVSNNVGADVGERLFNAGGNQTKVSLMLLGGRIYQEGRPLIDIHANTYEHTILSPQMRRRSGLETRGVLLIEALAPTGVLNDYDAIIFEPSPTDMSQDEKADYHFFLDTETCSIQRFSLEGSHVTMETAFVAGKATPTSERHDLSTISKLSKKHGVAVATTDGTNMIQYVILVPKASLPNGLVNIVQEYDDVAGGTFYGEARPRQDYLAYAQECKERIERLHTITERITAQLISEVAAFTTPLEAIERLDYLSERLCVQYSVEHSDIKAAIFGPQAALHIEEARFFFELGDSERGNQSLRQAQQTANSGSCPLFKRDKKSEEADTNGDNGSAEASSGKKWMSCPHCGAKVFADPCAARLSCWDCKAAVVNGQVRSKGDGGSRARAANKLAEQKDREKELVEQVDAIYKERGLDLGSSDGDLQSALTQNSKVVSASVPAKQPAYN